MVDTLRWGILGTGNIAHQFAEGVRDAKRSRIVAVGSRTPTNAQAFAKQFDIERAYGSYAALIADEQVDAVYVSLPNTMHHEWAIAALRAGRHVLCEKPLAANAEEAREMFRVAGESRRLLVEAFMYRTHPMMQQVVQHVRDGAIGELRLIRASFSYCTRKIDGNIRFDPALAGGALMDIGCYCIDLSRLLADESPDDVHAVGHLHSTGVDDYAAGTLSYPGGLIAGFTCGMSVQADNTAYLCGSEGYISIPIPWKPPRQGAEYTLACMTPPRLERSARQPQPPRTMKIDAPMALYGMEADAFAASVLDDRPSFMPADHSLDNMDSLDRMRRQVGVID
jgi:predicted dehydrogenase